MEEMMEENLSSQNSSPESLQAHSEKEWGL